MTEFFPKMCNGYKPKFIAIFVKKNSIIDVREGPEYVFEVVRQKKNIFFLSTVFFVNKAYNQYTSENIY